MPFYFRCPHCNTELEAEYDWAGMETSCPNCSQTITIPLERDHENSEIKLSPTDLKPQPDTQKKAKKNISSDRFTFLCPLCGTLTELDASLQNQEYECPACCEKSIAVPATEKPCPYCGKMIKFRAKICRFCKKQLSVEKKIL